MNCVAWIVALGTEKVRRLVQFCRLGSKIGIRIGVQGGLAFQGSSLAIDQLDCQASHIMT